MFHCTCRTCILNGLQGRGYIEYNNEQYCTAHPQYISIKRYKQALDKLIEPKETRHSDWYFKKIDPIVQTPSPKPKPVLDTYLLSFRDGRGVEQDWFIMSDCDEDASNQAMDFIKKLPFAVHEFTFVKEMHVKFIQLLNR